MSNIDKTPQDTLSANHKSASDLRDKADLIAYLACGHKVKYLFFWGHTANTAGEVGKECFSQWYPAAFTIDGIQYPTAEHYMMAEKARLFGDADAEQKILASSHPGDAKMLGRGVRDYVDTQWKKHRFEIVVRGNVAKFSQHPQLQEFLLASEQRVLVEASPRDNIWGIGLGQDNLKAKIPSEWRGLNLLGFALMEVRARLLKIADSHV